jgi:hypothetical protein
MRARTRESKRKETLLIAPFSRIPYCFTDIVVRSVLSLLKFILNQRMEGRKNLSFKPHSLKDLPALLR